MRLNGDTGLTEVTLGGVYLCDTQVFVQTKDEKEVLDSSISSGLKSMTASEQQNKSLQRKRNPSIPHFSVVTGSDASTGLGSTSRSSEEFVSAPGRQRKDFYCRGNVTTNQKTRKDPHFIDSG